MMGTRQDATLDHLDTMSYLDFSVPPVATATDTSHPAAEGQGSSEGQAGSEGQDSPERQGSLAPLGLDAISEDLYRLMLAHPDDGLAALARRHRITEVDVRRALDRLAELSLIKPSAGTGSGFRPVAPEIAMDLLISRQQARLAAEQARMEQSRAAAAHLIAKCSAPDREARQSGSTRLIGVDAVRERLNYLSHNAVTEVMRFAPGGTCADSDVAAHRRCNEEMVRRGVRVRTVYQESIRHHAPTWEYANWLCDIGGEVRTTSTLPTSLVIYDRRQAVVPIDPTNARAGGILLSGDGVVAALTALFEPIWTDAVPIGTPEEPCPEALSRQESQVLRLLAAGMTDEAVAKRLGCSPRTARRIASQLMERLGAQSRFQAGVHAAANGWLPTGR
jgi:DNA-binding CsgD family transcriptional regulator